MFKILMLVSIFTFSAYGAASTLEDNEKRDQSCASALSKLQIGWSAAPLDVGSVFKKIKVPPIDPGQAVLASGCGMGDLMVLTCTASQHPYALGAIVASAISGEYVLNESTKLYFWAGRKLQEAWDAYPLPLIAGAAVAAGSGYYLLMDTKYPGLNVMFIAAGLAGMHMVADYYQKYRSVLQLQALQFAVDRLAHNPILTFGVFILAAYSLDGSLATLDKALYMQGIALLSTLGLF